MRAPSSALVLPDTLLYAVAKWLCQNSAIFSCSGRRLCVMRNSQRWRASVMTVDGEKAPFDVVPTYPGVPIFASTSSGRSA